MYYVIAYLAIGALGATVMKLAIPEISLVGWSWYAATWPWQLLCVHVKAFAVAPRWLIPYLFNL